MQKVDTSRIKSIASANPTSKKVFSVLAQRERSSRTTNLAQFRHILKIEHGFEVNRDHYDNIWEQLEAIGLGRLERTTRGLPAKFDWMGFTSQSVGKSGLDPRQHPERAKFRNRGTPEADTLHHRLSGNSRKVVVREPPVAAMRQAQSEAPATAEYETVFAAFTSSPSHTSTFATDNAEIQIAYQGALSPIEKDRVINWIKRLPTKG